MGRIARRVLSRLAPLFLLGAVGLVVFRTFDESHRTDGYLMGYVVVLCQLGLGGLLCGALRDTEPNPGARARREAAEMLLRALEATPPQPDEGLGHLRAVDGSPREARRSSTPADEESARPPGA